MSILSHPFRLEPNGTAATVEDGTPEAFDEALAVMALTRKGERVLVPEFGITDPPGLGIDAGELTAGVALFGPDVTIVDVAAEFVDDRREEVIVVYDDAPTDTGD